MTHNILYSRLTWIGFSFFLILNVGFTQVPSFDEKNPSIVFFGSENIFSIRLNETDPENITVKAHGAHVYKRDDSTYVVNPNQAFEEIKVKLYFKNIVCGQKTVSVRQQPMFIPKMDKEVGVYIYKKDLEAIEKIYLTSEEESNVQFVSKISSYNLYILDPNGINLFSGSLRDENLSPQVKEIISKLKTGSRISISNIRALNNRNQLNSLSAQKEWVVIE